MDDERAKRGRNSGGEGGEISPGETGANVEPLVLKRAHTRSELAALLDVSPRTIQLHVNSDDIRREMAGDGRPRYTLLPTPWTLEKLANKGHIEGGRNGGEMPASPFAPGRKEGAKQGRNFATRQQVRGEALEQLRGDLVANHEELAQKLQTTREEVTGELQDVRAMVEEVAARIERQASVAGFATSGEAPEATESDSGEDDAHQRGEEDRGRERRQDLVWWRVLLVSLLMRIKLWADSLLERFSR